MALGLAPLGQRIFGVAFPGLHFLLHPQVLPSEKPELGGPAVRLAPGEPIQRSGWANQTVTLETGDSEPVQ